MMPCKIKSEHEPSYSVDYIKRRVEEEGDEGYSSPCSSGCVDNHHDHHVENNIVDAMDLDADEQPDTSDQTIAEDTSAGDKEVCNTVDSSTPPKNSSPTSKAPRKRAPRTHRTSTTNKQRKPQPPRSPPPKKPRQLLFCTVPDCTFKKPFSSQSNLNRHNRAYHSPSSSRQEGFPCPECGEKFARRDNVGKHRDMVHGIPRGSKKRRRVSS